MFDETAEMATDPLLSSPIADGGSMRLTSWDGLRLDAESTLPSGGTSGAVLLVHGINADRDEGGMYARLAVALAAAGLEVLRFSFRGHGASAGTSRGATIAGEMLDLQAAVEYLDKAGHPRLSIVASSFGAVATTASLTWLAPRLDRLMLWNPVLDLQRTFVDPELPWGVENFGPAQQKLLTDNGFLVIDGEFELGRVMFGEFGRYHPLDDLAATTIPALIVHGDRDSAVSYDISRDAARRRPNTDFHTVAGSDHGFDSREREDEAIAVTVAWLTDGAAS